MLKFTAILTSIKVTNFVFKQSYKLYQADINSVIIAVAIKCSEFILRIPVKDGIPYKWLSNTLTPDFRNYSTLLLKNVSTYTIGRMDIWWSDNGGWSCYISVHWTVYLEAIEVNSGHHAPAAGHPSNFP